MKNIIMIMLGGGLGAASRFLVGLTASRLFGAAYPWGTLLVNLTGCFAIGFLFTLMERTQALEPSTRLFLITGFLGSLTTFSTYALESISAARTAGLLQVLANVTAHNIGGLLLVVGGMWIAGRILSGS
jgi:CrcB protein